MENIEWLTIAEACRVLKVSRRTLYTYMESDRLPYYQLSSNGHRRIRAEDLDRLMILASSPSSASINGGSEEIIEDIGLQERRPGFLTIERDYSWMPKYYEDLEQLRPLDVWTGHPCALCGGALRGVVKPEIAEKLLRDLAHKECLTKRQESNWFPFVVPSLDRRLYEAE